jgi:hypothetical protein
MKNLFLSVFLMISSISLYSQKISYLDLLVSKKPKGDFLSYESKDGTIFRKGEILLVGEPYSHKSFTYITHGNGLSSSPETHLVGKASGLQAKIIKITVGGFKKSGYYVQATCSTPVNSMFLIKIRLEDAFQTAEIRSEKNPLLYSEGSTR